MQSEYRFPGRAYEIETVNEILTTKKKLNDENEVEVSGIQRILNKRFFKNSNKSGAKNARKNSNFKFLRNKLKSHSEPSKSAALVKTPLIILQTDDDGLKRLRNSHRNSNFDITKSVDSFNNNVANTLKSTRLSTISVESSFKNSKSSLNSINSSNALNQHNKRRNSISVDQCEVSQQITTV